LFTFLKNTGAKVDLKTANRTSALPWGCNVECRFMPCKIKEDWMLDAPVGRPCKKAEMLQAEEALHRGRAQMTVENGFDLETE
jgi:hypothetical protein